MHHNIILKLLGSMAWMLMWPSLVSADGQSEHWGPISKTAQSITGKVLFSSNRIQFENKAYLDISFDRTVSDFDTDVGTVLAWIYQVQRPADPKLLRGNRLCGEAVHYLVLTKGDLSERSIQLGVFAKDEIPRSEKTACATYFYERIPPKSGFPFDSPS